MQTSVAVLNNYWNCLTRQVKTILSRAMSYHDQTLFRNERTFNNLQSLINVGSDAYPEKTLYLSEVFCLLAMIIPANPCTECPNVGQPDR